MFGWSNTAAGAIPAMPCLERSTSRPEVAALFQSSFAAKVADRVLDISPMAL